MDKKILGRYSKADMTRTEAFFLPMAQDPFGTLKPQLTLEALRLSLELAQTSYDLDLDQWLNAGWTDVSVQAETKLFTGIRSMAFSPDNTMDYVKNSLSYYRSKLSINNLNPISQVMGALRQRKGSDTGKVLVMAKKHDDGKYLIAIGFMGTSGKFYDWFSNFRMTSEEGFHKGFLQLARQFENNEERIVFPTVAAELGLEGLTLSAILDECRQKDSRFRIWMAGHSQGGAVMQVWGHLKLRENNVLDENMVGYGFASPASALGVNGVTPSAYPFYHVLNSDDFVPRMGSRVHLGLVLTYPAGKSLREHCYAWADDESGELNRARLRRVTRRMVDTPSCIESGVAYLELLLKQPVEEIHKAAAELQMKFLPIKQMLAMADRRDADVIRFIERRVDAAYEQMTGHPLARELVESIKDEMGKLIDDMGVVKFTATLMQLMLPAHTLVNKGAAPYGSYEYIIDCGYKSLHASIWESGTPPTRRWYDAAEEEAMHEALMQLVVRHKKKTNASVAAKKPSHRSAYTRARAR